MSITFEIVSPRSAVDVSRQYVNARVAGLEVSHFETWKCSTFDAVPATNSVLGVFRSIGSLIFHKDERRWEVRARADANPVDLATLIEAGLINVERFGRSPGHRTRDKCFEHRVSQRTGKRIAEAVVCYRLNADDLMLTTITEVELPAMDEELRRILA